MNGQGPSEEGQGRNLVRATGKAVAVYPPYPCPATPESLGQALARPAFFGILLIVVFFGGFVLWGALAPIAGGAVAPGVISPDGSRKTVQHLEGGIISVIHVRDGDAVKAGQPLIELQRIKADAVNTMLEHQRLTNLAAWARLDAEAARQDKITFPPELDESDPQIATILEGQRRLFETRRASYEARSKVLNQRVAQLQEQIKGYEAQVASAKVQMALFRDELRGKKELYDKGLLRKPDLRHLQRLYADIEGRHGQYRAAIARAEQEIGETRLQMLALDAERDDRIVSQRDELRAKLAEIDERLMASRDVLDRTVIRAPVSGTVMNLKFKTLSAVVRPGEPILEIVPSEDKLVIDARISPLDIDAVRTWISANIYLKAYSTRATPRIPGKVTSVSADAIVDPGTKNSYYLARVEVNRADIRRHAPGVELIPGMPADVLLVTGERTMLQYLFQPFIDALRRSFRES